MIFYIDNQIEQRKEFSHQELIQRFLKNSRAYENYLNGIPFERSFLNTLPGTPEPVVISDENWNALKEELDRQDPKPNYKF